MLTLVMILRTWKAKVDKTREGEYLSLVRERILPHFKEMSGCKAAYFSKKLGSNPVEYQVVTFWESLAAVREMAGEETTVAYVPDFIAKLLSAYDESVEHWEVVIEQESS